MKMFKDDLRAMSACKEAVAWVGNRTLDEAWRDCKRADWMLWWLEKILGPGCATLILCACDCAETVLKFVPMGEDRPRLAIEAALKCVENPSKENKALAAAAAWAAGAGEVAAKAAANAAWLAAWAARAAARVAGGAETAGVVAWAATEAVARAAEAAWLATGTAWAVAEAAWAVAWAAHQKEMADLIRRRVPNPPIPQ